MILRLRVGEHVEHELIVDFDEGNFDSDLVVETAANLAEDFVDGARDQSSVLVVRRRTAHSESFSSTGLTVAHDCAIEAIDDLMDSLLCTILKDFLLGSVMHNFVEFECPLLLLIVYNSLCAIFGHA